MDARSLQERKSWRRQQRELLTRNVTDHHSYFDHNDISSSSNSRIQRQQRELALLQAVASGRGFVAQQLRDAPLSPLTRWFHQLQLLALGDTPPQEDSKQLKADAAATALQALNRTLGHDAVKCFDVHFASDALCTQDEAALLLDDDMTLGVPVCLEELLSFSTMKRGRVCRVTCVRRSGEPQYAFRSSLYVRDLEATASRLLLQSPHASNVESFVELLWRELAPWVGT